MDQTELIKRSTDLIARPARTKYHGPSRELKTISMEGGMHQLHSVVLLLFCNGQVLHLYPGDWNYSTVYKLLELATMFMVTTIPERNFR